MAVILNSMIKKSIVVIYHADCNDGFGGAYAAWKKFGDTAAYIPVHYNEPVLEGLQNKEIYLVDFCYDEEIIKALMANNKRVTAIDHHVTREAIVKLTQDYSYAIDHSGAVLAWKYFHPQKQVPRLLLHIEDNDLWKFALSHTEDIRAVLKSKARDFKIWDGVARKLENKKQRAVLIKKGETLREFEKMLIQEIVDQYATLVEFEGYKTFAVNSSLWRSEIGKILARRLPPIGIIWFEKGGRRMVSLRSIGETNVATIAEKYGGGGHKNAAGFSMPIHKPTPWKLIQ